MAYRRKLTDFKIERVRNATGSLDQDVDHIVIKDNNDGIYTYYKMFVSPFNNCQSFSIASFASFTNILQRGLGTTIGTDEYVKDNVATFINAIRTDEDSVKKRQMVVDVRAMNEAFIDKYSPNQLVKAPYTNSTGSQMIFYVIKLW